MASISHLLRSSGLDAKRTLAAPANFLRYRKDRKRFRAAMNSNFAWGAELPILGEWRESSGGFGGYFLQDRLVARWIYEAKPENHVDVGSRIDGFIGHLSVFREVDVLDIRPQTEEIENVTFHQVDLMKPLPDRWEGTAASLSCLHTIEHFGLGRYGDGIDPDGHLKGIAQLQRMVRPGGMFYLSTQIGPQRVEFNAHRVFAPETMLAWFANGWTIERCAVIDDSRKLNEDADAKLLQSFKGQFGLGIVAARKTAVDADSDS